MPNEPCILARFHKSILLTNQKRFSVLQLTEAGDLVLFAGSAEGNQDVPASTCSFKQPLGISTEFDSVVYVCDAQTNSIKLLTRMKHCSKLLNAMGGLYEAFSIHKKCATYNVKSLSEALGLVRNCQSLLQNNEHSIRSEINESRAINGPQGHISAKTVISVDLIESGLERLRTILAKFNFNACNLLSCMTLDVENCHATVHFKQANMSMLEYSSAFGTTMKKSVKCITHWGSFLPHRNHGIQSQRSPFISCKSPL